MEALDEFTLHQHLASQPGKALVLFSSPGCGGCRAVERLLPRAVPPDVRLYKVDVQRAQALARAYEVFHLPALFLFVDGQYHARLNCEIGQESLRQALDAALAAPAEEEP